jgi:murein DD-endopeptidase MepM/ murein hydrolase activator NlpD
MKRFTLKVLGLMLLSCSGLTDAEQPLVQIFTAQPQQGSMIVGRMLVDGDVMFEGKRLELTETGEFVFGVGRDFNGNATLTVISDQKKTSYPISIDVREWKIERIDGLAKEKVNPRSKETLARIKLEGQKVASARTVWSEQNAFLMNFVLPAKGRISGVYGSQRVLNGEPKRPHYGLDIANKTGTAVVAPADGIVTLVEKDLFFSGGTIIIDHGFGINSTYLHLDSVTVELGQELKQGDSIGTIGATGRATGPHLDWRLNWKNVRLDPQLLVLD